MLGLGAVTPAISWGLGMAAGGGGCAPPAAIFIMRK